VNGYLSRARRAGITWPVPDDLDDEQLERLLFPLPPDVPVDQRPVPDWAVVHRELRRPNMTLALLWEEYRSGAPDGFGYSWFCDLYRTWVGRLKPTLRQVHVAGERMFVDFAGQTMEVFDGTTGEARRAEIFVAVLGASSYTYAEAVWSQSLPEWISAHVNALAFFDGVPRQIVCDNLRSGITRACFYEPLVNRTYADMARHYGTTVIPARPYKARDKAKVEVGVQVVQRWILARLRHRRFFSLAELNSAIRALLAIERPSNARLGHDPACPLPAGRSAGAATVATDTLRIRRMEALPSQSRLSCRDRAALLFGALSAAAANGRGTHHREVGGDLPPGQAGGHPSTQSASASTQHGARSHAELAPPLSRLDT